MLHDHINTWKPERLHSEAERRRMVARAWGGRKKEANISNDVISQPGSRNSRTCHVIQWLELRTIQCLPEINRNTFIKTFNHKKCDRRKVIRSIQPVHTNMYFKTMCLWYIYYTMCLYQILCISLHNSENAVICVCFIHYIYLCNYENAVIKIQFKNPRNSAPSDHRLVVT